MKADQKISGIDETARCLRSKEATLSLRGAFSQGGKLRRGLGYTTA